MLYPNSLFVNSMFVNHKVRIRINEVPVYHEFMLNHFKCHFKSLYLTEIIYATYAVTNFDVSNQNINLLIT